MLPVMTTAQLIALEAKGKRRLAAHSATNEMQRWVLDKPDMRYAVGNLFVVWHALAVEGTLDKTIAAAEQDLASLPASFDRLARNEKTNRVAALQHYSQSFTAALHAA